MQIKDANTFGSVIRKRRKELGYTQKQISFFTGYSESFLSNLENGKETAEIGKAINVVNILGINLIAENR